MTAWLLALLLLQGTPAPKGFAAGVVRSANGAPAAGVRVYAVPAGDPNAVSTGATVFESLAQTDASGRYRLEVPVGRYFIAVGSVTSPTYYPDTPSVASAKAISITAGSTVENVDFSRYTVALTPPLGYLVHQSQVLSPGSTGVLSGMVRASDGSVASGITVVAMPVSVLSGSIAQIFSLGSRRTVVETDSQGRYRIENVSPDTYVILAGYSDFPIYYPGTSDSLQAKSITTTPSTSLTTLDIAMPPPAGRLSVRGRIFWPPGFSAGEVVVNTRQLGIVTTSPATLLLPLRNSPQVAVASDGSFEVAGLFPGKYTLQARFLEGLSMTKAVEVTDRSAELVFDFSKNVLSGRILLEDGRPFSDASIREIAVTSTSNPNEIATTVLPVASDGRFIAVIEPGDYRFYVRSLPDDYVIRSSTSGAVDLAKETLHVVAEVPTFAEIRVAKAAESSARVRGRVVDASRQRTPVAEFIEFCCLATGPFERLSTPLTADGSFEISQLPPGRYTAVLRGKTGLSFAGIVNQAIEVGTGGQSSLTLVSSDQVAPVSATIRFEGGTSIPPTNGLKVALTFSLGTTEEASVPMAKLREMAFWTPFPTGVRYSINVTGIPEGYRVKSITGPGSMSAVPTLDSNGRSQVSGFAPGEISIVFERIP
jgi:hypothetical protein